MTLAYIHQLYIRSKTWVSEFCRFFHGKSTFHEVFQGTASGLGFQIHKKKKNGRGRECCRNSDESRQVDVEFINI